MRLIHTPVLGLQPELVGAPCHRQSKSFSFPHSAWPPQSDPSCCLSSKGFLQSNPLRVPLGWPNHAESQPRPRSHLQNKPLAQVHRVDGVSNSAQQSILVILNFLLKCWALQNATPCWKDQLEPECISTLLVMLFNSKWCKSFWWNWTKLAC